MRTRAFRRASALAAVAAALSIVPSVIHAQTRTVALAPLAPPEGRPELIAAVEQVNRTALLTLQLLGDYDVSRLDEGDALSDPAEARRLAEENGYDNVIFGEARLNERGQLVLSMRVYDRFLDEVTLESTQVARRLLAVFDTADILVTELVSAFSGRVIRFGAIDLRLQPRDASVSVSLDGTAIANVSEAFERVLTGERTVRVSQERMFGETTVFERTATVAADETTRISVEIPELTRREAQTLAELSRTIRESLPRRSARPEVSVTLSRLGELVADASYSAAIPEWQERHAQLRGEFDLAELRRDIVDGREEDGDGAAETAAERTLALYRGAQDYRDPERIRTAAVGSLRIYMELLALRSAGYLSERDFAAAEEALVAAGDDDLGVNEALRAVQGELDADLTFLRDLVEERVRLADRGSPFWDGTALVGGLAFGAGSGFLLATDYASTLYQDAMTTYEEQYVPATEASEAESLHRQVRREIVLANTLEITKWAGLGLSPAGIFQAVRGWYRRRVAPDRHVSEQLEARFGREMDAALSLFGDGGRRRGASRRRDGADALQLVVTGFPADTPVAVDGRSIGATPLVREIDPTEDGGDAAAGSAGVDVQGRELTVTVGEEDFRIPAEPGRRVVVPR